MSAEQAEQRGQREEPGGKSRQGERRGQSKSEKTEQVVARADRRTGRGRREWGRMGRRVKFRSKGNERNKDYQGGKREHSQRGKQGDGSEESKREGSKNTLWH